MAPNHSTQLCDSRFPPSLNGMSIGQITQLAATHHYLLARFIKENSPSFSKTDPTSLLPEVRVLSSLFSLLSY